MMALPKLLFHVPQQSSSKDTMTESFQIQNWGGGGGGLFNLANKVVSGFHKN